MLKLGCHLSISKGFLHIGKEALSIGANTFQFFTRNPRCGSAKPVDEKDAAAFRQVPAFNPDRILCKQVKMFRCPRGTHTASG